MLNGAESFQREIINDASFYNKCFPGVTNADIVMLENAGHGLHFEHPIKVRKLIHSFLLANDEDFEGAADEHNIATNLSDNQRHNIK